MCHQKGVFSVCVTLGVDIMGPLPQSSNQNEICVQFVSTVFRELCESWNITPKLTTACHPQTNTLKE